jgi:hypothetical protein
MQRFQRQCFQDQQVESSTQKISTFLPHAVVLSEYDKECLTVPENLQPTVFHFREFQLIEAQRTHASGLPAFQESDLARLEQILALKFIGFSLKDIRNFSATLMHRRPRNCNTTAAVLQPKCWQRCGFSGR